MRDTRTLTQTCKAGPRAWALALLALLPLPALADCATDSALAVAFMDSYLELIDSRSEQPVEDWLKEQPLAAPVLVEGYVAERERGLAVDPELGWGMDLLLDAQDSPDEGFEPYRCEADGLLQLQGKDWPAFKLAVRLVDTAEGRKVGAAGRINLNEAERAPR